MINWNAIGAMILPNIGGWVGALTMSGEVRSANGTSWYESINKPSWNPPNWVFGPAWTALYTGMGYASYMVYEDCGGLTDDAVIPLALYGGHLLLNWTWTPVFFKFHQIGLALIHMFALDAAATACTVDGRAFGPPDSKWSPTSIDKGIVRNVNHRLHVFPSLVPNVLPSLGTKLLFCGRISKEWVVPTQTSLHKARSPSKCKYNVCLFYTPPVIGIGYSYIFIRVYYIGYRYIDDWIFCINT